MVQENPASKNTDPCSASLPIQYPTKNLAPVGQIARHRGSKATVYANEAEVDPNNEFCWKSLAMGFALSKGLDTEKSWNFVQILLEKGII